MKNSCITFIGGGNMAASLVLGLQSGGYDSQNIRVADPSDTRRALLAASGVKVFESNAEALAGAQAIIIAVKPQITRTVAQSLQPHLSNNQLVLSIAAGVTLQSLQGWLGPEPSLVRCMPNTPALYGVGVTGLFSADTLSTSELELAETIMGAVGKTLWLESEAQLDAVTAISGSGPAYYFYLTESLVNAGRQLGLSEATSKLLAEETAFGAATMLRESEDDASTLRKNVTSPGGTTAAALEYMQDRQLSEIIMQAAKSAAERSVELGEIYSDNS